MRVLRDVFTQQELQDIRGLPEVYEAHQKLETRASVYFTIPITDIVSKALQQSFDLDFSTHTQIPCRWIKGDTPAHIDRGSSSFDNTYLVYLTEGEGTFRIEEESYPIEAGTGFSFSEGLSHEVTGTNGSSRLLLGPMSEEGFAVGDGSVTLQGNGETDTLFIRDSGGTIQWKRDSTNPDNVTDWASLVGEPVNLENTASNKSANILKLLFESNITITSVSFYFECISDGIQVGSSSLGTGGGRATFTIDSISGYAGLIRNGGSATEGKSHIYVYNLQVENSGSTLASAGGWIGQGYFGKNATNNYILNCVSNGAIPVNGGGIVGEYAAYRTTADSTSLTIIGCSSTGNMVGSAGGIVGRNAGNGTGASCTIEQCFSEGAIGQSAGGIVGQSAGVVTCTKCYSNGSSIDNAGGGIFGRFAGAQSGNSAVADSCYSTGTIGLGAGGIFGREAGTTSGSATAINCYSIGQIDTTGGSAGGGGIFGREYANQTITNCYVVGAISGGTSVGYILANSATIPSTTYSEANSGGSGWSDTNANSVLTGFPVDGVGTTWASSGTDSAYELANFGPTPYQQQTVSGNALVQSFSQSVTPGNSTNEAIAADASGNAFTILKKTGGDTESHPRITISAQTGAISTTPATLPGTYTITVRSVGSYFITTFVLTVSPDAVSESSSSTCCVTTINERGLDYAQINDYRIGNRLLLEVSQNSKTTFDGYSQYVKYKMAQGSRKV